MTKSLAETRKLATVKRWRDGKDEPCVGEGKAKTNKLTKR